MTDKKKRTRLTCHECGRTVKTLAPETGLCLQCRAAGRMPWALMSKHEREQARDIDRVLRVQHRMGGAA